MKIRRKSIMASESDGNYDVSFKKNGTTYYIEMLSDGGNYVAKWWDSSDNGLGYNNKGWVAIEGKNYRAINKIGDVTSDNVIDLLGIVSDYDRKPGKPIQDRIKREVAKLIDFGSINSGCTKKSVKASIGNSVELTFICPDLETGRLVADKAQEIGGFGSTWNETKWVYIAVPSTQSVDNVDDLIDYAQSVGVFLNRPSAKLLDEWADSKSDLVLRGSTDLSIKSNKINKRRAIKASDFEFIMDEPEDDEDDGSLAGYYSWDDLTDDQRDYVISHWGDFRSFADSMYEWFNDYIMDVYYEDKEMLADEYNEKYGFNIDTDKISWSSNSQGPYADNWWSNKEILGKVWLAAAGNLSDVDVSFDGIYDVDTYADYYVGTGDDKHIEYDIGVDELAEYGANEEAISIIRNLADGAQKFLDELWKLIHYTCTAYPDDEWVAEMLDGNPNSFTFIVDDNGEVEDIT